MLEETSGVREAASVRHLVALGYVDPVAQTARQAALARAQQATLLAAEKQLKLGEVATAIESLESLIDPSSDWSAPRHLLARAYSQTGRWADAAAQLHWLECQGVEHAELSLLRARMALRARALDAVRDHAEYAKCLQHPLPAAEKLIGEIAYRRGDLQSAEAAFKRVVEMPGAQPTAWAGLAAVALRRDELEQAIECSLQALEQQPRMASAHYRLGLALWKLNRLPEAMTALSTAAALNPRWAGPYRWLSRLARALNDFDATERYRRLGAEVIARRRSNRSA